MGPMRRRLNIVAGPRAITTRTVPDQRLIHPRAAQNSSYPLRPRARIVWEIFKRCVIDRSFMDSSRLLPSHLLWEEACTDYVATNGPS